MTIIWHGQSFFEILAGPTKNSSVKIAIDPFSEDMGLRFPKMEADIILVTHQHSDHNNIKSLGGNPFVISGPGEYEIKEVFIQGIPSFHDDSQGKERGSNTIFTIETEDLRLCHLGDLGQKELSSDQLEKIGEVDVLMIPVGGVYTISGKEAMKIMSQIEPKITIPMHYALPKLKVKLEEADKFLKLAGIKKLEPQNKLTVKKKDIREDEAKIIMLSP
jgi:L-ascorbate metabolism protein UlaG (beta-lactamase superfamily)